MEKVKFDDFIKLNRGFDLPDSQIEYDRYYRKLQKIYKKFTYSETQFFGKYWKNGVLRLYQRLLGDHHRYVKKADAERKKHSYENSGYVGTLISFYDYYNDRHKKEEYEGIIYVLFEGIQVKAPIGYDSILRKLYGDYQQLPPIEEQKTHHSYSVFWKD